MPEYEAVGLDNEQAAFSMPKERRTNGIAKRCEKKNGARVSQR